MGESREPDNADNIGAKLSRLIQVVEKVFTDAGDRADSHSWMLRQTIADLNETIERMQRNAILMRREISDLRQQLDDVGFSHESPHTSRQRRSLRPARYIEGSISIRSGDDRDIVAIPPVGFRHTFGAPSSRE